MVKAIQRTLFLVLALAALTGLSSCQKNDSVTSTAGPTISNISFNAATKTVGFTTNKAASGLLEYGTNSAFT